LCRPDTGGDHGPVVLKGKKGITGRGTWLTEIGVELPILFLIAYL